MFMYVRLITKSTRIRNCLSPTPGGDSSEVVEGHAREYEGFSLIFEHPPSSSLLRHFLILPSLLATIPATHPAPPQCHEQVLYPGDVSFPTPDFDSRNFATSRSFVRSRPHASPNPAILPYAASGTPWVPSSLVYELPDSFPSLCRLSLSPGISFEHFGRKSTSPVCSVANGSPRGRRSARHSGNKETLSSGLYSTLCLSSQGNHYRYYFTEFLTFCSSQCV